MIITLTIVSLLCTFLLKVLYALYGHLKLRLKLMWIPGPWGVSIFGTALAAILPKDVIFRALWKLSEKYKNGMFLIWHGKTAQVVLMRPHQMEVILKSQTLIKKSSSYNYLTEWLGNGLVTSTGDVWHRHRRLLTPAFHFAKLDQFTEVIFDKVGGLNASIKALVDEQPDRLVNFFPIAIKFTLDAVCKTVMGLDLDVQGKEDNEYAEALHGFVDLSCERYFCCWYWSDFLFYRTWRGKKYRHCIKTVQDFTFKVIEEKIKMRKENAEANVKKEAAEDSGEGKPTKLTPFLDLLIDLSEAEENPFTLKEVQEEAETFMFGAHDTTGIAISYVLFCLGNTPEAQEKAYDEINEVFQDSLEPPTRQQLAQLKYLDRVIKESLRLFPSAPFISRTLTHDVVIDGYHIPQGVEAYMLIMQMHWDPKVWTDPGKFDPDRFLPENSVGRHPYAYVPFSAGPRNCIGQKYAMLLMKVSLIRILREWIVRSDVALRDLKTTTQFVLLPPDQILNLRFKPRQRR